MQRLQRTRQLFNIRRRGNKAAWWVETETETGVCLVRSIRDQVTPAWTDVDPASQPVHSLS